MTRQYDSAYPLAVEQNGKEVLFESDGLTKREYFAAMALQGTLATADSDYGHTDSYTPILGKDGSGQYDEDGELIREVTETAAQKYARDAVKYADALIAALNETKDKDE